MAEFTYRSNAAAIIVGLQQSAEAAVEVTTENIADEARGGCPVGTVMRAGHTWKERTPGTLKNSIMTRVRTMRDGTDDVVGWVKAGTAGAPDGVSAFYAPFVNFGTSKMQAIPFMTNAFRHHGADELLNQVALEFSSVRRTGVK